MELFHGETASHVMFHDPNVGAFSDLVTTGDTLAKKMTLRQWKHGDIHPGNIMRITEGEGKGRVGLIDFGNTQYLPKGTVEQLSESTIKTNSVKATQNVLQQQAQPLPFKLNACRHMSNGINRLKK
jgi:predicted unusual protein kinase regulating ubiquinone biosynthesis (AarF/ABC1/UbiB family)